MMTEEPTPRPWQIKRTGRTGVWSQAGNKIASVEAPHLPPFAIEQGREANAQLIVRAVNAHEELLKAVQEADLYFAMLDQADEQGLDEQLIVHQLVTARNAVRAVIKRALTPD